jgi:hypothetical protein
MVEEKYSIIFYSILLYYILFYSIIIVQKNKVSTTPFCSNYFHKESTLFMNTTLYPRKESTL